MTGRYDAIGIGFGPSNLALAIALEERGDTGRMRFFERQARFGWHRDMLLPGATLQVNHLKDLVTLRDPRSSFSFVNYLHEQGRLIDYINLKTSFPTRLEFHDYLQWAAARVAPVCDYGTEVVEVRLVGDGHRIDALAVDVVRDGIRESIETDSIVVGAGLRPRLPHGVEPSARVWHSDAFLSALAGLPASAHGRFAVVGAGQSAAEIVEYLHTGYPDAAVHAIFGRFGFAPADDSPYANRIFDPATIDEFHGAPVDVRERLLRVHANTNYSVVDLDLIEELYRREYAEIVRGARRLHVENVSRVERVMDRPDGVTLTIRDESRGTTREIEVDAVVFATGYEPVSVDDLLPALAARFARDEQGRVIVERDYRLRTDDAFAPAVYLQGGTEHTHGLTSSLLSAVAVRAGEIVESLALRRAEARARRGALVGNGVS
ncbi:MAG: SidA/IucD/PvdA family monooxygenase [Microbacterium enclense]